MSSFSYDRYDRPRRQHTRTTFGYWVPLVVTATIAAGGLAAWVWSAREDDSSDDDTDLSYGDRDAIEPSKYRSRDQYSQSQGVDRERHDDGTFIGRMSDVIRRTPSPQQAYDIARGKVVAGVAAAGAMMGGALSSIREEDRDAYEDHARWSEQAALQRGVAAQSTDSRGAVSTHTDAFNTSIRQGKASGKRKTVAIVLSAESASDAAEDSTATFIENASILSHLPPIASTTKLLILIHAPPSTHTAPSTSKPRSRRSSHHSTSLGSSYSTVSTPADELTSLDPRPDPYNTPGTNTPSHESAVYRDIHAQASRLVDDQSHILTFSTPTGHVHLLRHLGPDVVYMIDALSGPAGENVAQLRDWVGQMVVVVGGDGGGALGGLIDTEDESDGKGKKAKRAEAWWQSSEMVGLGKRVEVVEGVRMAEDFERRVLGRD